MDAQHCFMFARKSVTDSVTSSLDFLEYFKILKSCGLLFFVFLLSFAIIPQYQQKINSTTPCGYSTYWYPNSLNKMDTVPNWQWEEEIWRTSCSQHCASMGEHCADSSKCSSVIQGAQRGGSADDYSCIDFIFYTIYIFLVLHIVTFHR